MSDDELPDPRRITAWADQFSESAHTISEEYRKYATVKLDGDTIFAYAPDGDVVAIKKYVNCNKRILNKLISDLHPNIVIHSRILQLSLTEIEITQEPMDTTLGQVLSAPMDFTEKQMATVCREVC